MVVILVLLNILLTSYVLAAHMSQQNKTIYFVTLLVLNLLLIMFKVY